MKLPTTETTNNKKDKDKYMYMYMYMYIYKSNYVKFVESVSPYGLNFFGWLTMTISHKHMFLVNTYIFS